MIYILDNGDMFPKLLKTITKWLDFEVKEITDLEFEHQKSDILILNAEHFTKLYHKSKDELWKKFEKIQLPIIIVVDDSALGWGPTQMHVVDNRPIYILTPSIGTDIPKFGIEPDDENFNYLLTHIAENSDENVTTELLESGKSFLRSKHFLSLNREPKPHRDFLYNFIDTNNLYSKFYYSYTKKKEPIFLDGDKDWGRHSVLDPTDINYVKHYDSYFSVITLPEYEKGHNHFIDEKMWKPILSHQPFILLGAPFYLKTLKSFGFQTFFDLIDESYDTMINDKQRWNRACAEIKKLSKTPISKIHQWYYSPDTQLKLKHNYNVAKKMSWQQREKVSSLIENLQGYDG